VLHIPCAAVNRVHRGVPKSAHCPKPVCNCCRDSILLTSLIPAPILPAPACLPAVELVPTLHLLPLILRLGHILATYDLNDLSKQEGPTGSSVTQPGTSAAGSTSSPMPLSSPPGM
jgi:hypothetical protein